eukprot:CAMPEP_0171308678 /NCGR_PEP_ID=MMETSP0816-20121228/18777_1 /TAXON_ID=420281 /ORGANISM="Proboscia inermis, Strain CCAP1064/1" /LENGTH=84 /DNA_ID=CAMNT_0011791697 /DNA_START=295 /DNA_END=549 /DNA_ORIENTATION=+
MLNTFELLLKKFPESINHKTAQSLSPVETVLKGRNPEKGEIVALLRTAQEMLRDLHQRIELKNQMFENAAQKDTLHRLKMAIDA